MKTTITLSDLAEFQANQQIGRIFDETERAVVLNNCFIPFFRVDWSQRILRLAVALNTLPAKLPKRWPPDATFLETHLYVRFSLLDITAKPLSASPFTHEHWRAKRFCVSEGQVEIESDSYRIVATALAKNIWLDDLAPMTTYGVSDFGGPLCQTSCRLLF